jgi:hypothetical protein
MTTLIILIALLYLAGMAKAFSDAVTDENVKNAEWQRKYDFTKPVGREWWYFGLYKPTNAEKFPFSTTILVFLTDRWHLSQFLMLRCFYTMIAISLFSNIWMILVFVLIIFPVITGMGFESTYQEFRKYIRNKK